MKASERCTIAVSKKTRDELKKIMREEYMDNMNQLLTVWIYTYNKNPLDPAYPPVEFQKAHGLHY